jgi:hypothetical protein
LEAKFSVYYRIPDYVGDGFVVAPAEARDWIIITDESPILAPMETKEIQVVLNIPEQAQIAHHLEFWIGVEENTNKTLSTELCSRFLITMK